jgi:hypothetical protein
MRPTACFGHGAPVRRIKTAALLRPCRKHGPRHASLRRLDLWPSDADRTVRRPERWIKTQPRAGETLATQPLAPFPHSLSLSLVAAAGGDRVARRCTRRRWRRAPRRRSSPSLPFLNLLSASDASWSTRWRHGIEEEPAPLCPPCRRVRAPVGARTAVKRLSGGALCPLRRWCSSSPCLGLPMRMKIERNGHGLTAALLCRRARGLSR